MKSVFSNCRAFTLVSEIVKPEGVDLRPTPETAVNIYTPKDAFEATVVSKRRINDLSSPNYAWHIVLDIDGSEMQAYYRIGQSIGIIPDGRFNDPVMNHIHRGLNAKIRLYSIASASWGDSWDGKTVSVCVKREMSEDPETGELVFGADSNYICDASPGDKVRITGPVGKSFLLPDDPLDHDYVFVATGTGVSPYRGMLIELFNRGIERDVWLVFGVPYSTDVMYESEFRHFAEAHSNFRFITAISREQKNARGGKRYVQDALAENESELIPLLKKQSAMLYMCGLKEMDNGIYQWLARNNSNLISLPEGIDAEAVQRLPRDAAEWPIIERTRDKERFLKETY
jgi:ferredoxin--NADP+ reductase